MMNKFEVKNMDLYYGSFHALKNINIAIPEKEVTAFIGPSGCGKSTFLKSLNRMNDLVPGVRIEGDVRLKGEDIFARGLCLPSGSSLTDGEVHEVADTILEIIRNR